ncbi:hypothetical protein NDU88_006610 [Pleurodeles waltl]|uniref:Uncharacterized protein n=1 Tax=Pleurodeles waltl TaxID=8319 RepID=A0AAV7U0M9_PLEWA|nr:hypothetical protein NDU88_006610 [Pleurodeles waltl]
MIEAVMAYPQSCYLQGVHLTCGIVAGRFKHFGCLGEGMDHLAGGQRFSFHSLPGSHSCRRGTRRAAWQRVPSVKPGFLTPRNPSVMALTLFLPKAMPLLSRPGRECTRTDRVRKRTGRAAGM